jgi:hypothetical protein
MAIFPALGQGCRLVPGTAQDPARLRDTGSFNCARDDRFVCPRELKLARKCKGCVETLCKDVMRLDIHETGIPCGASAY